MTAGRGPTAPGYRPPDRPILQRLTVIPREPLVVTGAFRASAWRGEHAPLTVLTTSVATTAAAAIGLAHHQQVGDHLQ